MSNNVNFPPRFIVVSIFLDPNESDHLMSVKIKTIPPEGVVSEK